MLNKEVSSTVLKVFGMTPLGIELRSPGPCVLSDTLCVYKMHIIKIISMDIDSTLNLQVLMGFFNIE